MARVRVSIDGVAEWESDDMHREREGRAGDRDAGVWMDTVIISRSNASSEILLDARHPQVKGRT